RSQRVSRRPLPPFAGWSARDVDRSHRARDLAGRLALGPGDSVLGPRRIPHAFVYDGTGPGRILIGFTPAARIEQFFRDLEKRGEYFGNGSAEDKELVHRLYGIVNVGPR